MYSLDIGADLTLTDILNSDILCKSGLALNSKCNSVSYGANMKVDSSSGLVKCDWSKDEKCRYNNTDKSTFELDCECALNSDGNSWCRAAQSESKKLF